jgi:two-component sensor histidine kinase
MRKAIPDLAVKNDNSPEPRDVIAKEKKFRDRHFDGTPVLAGDNVPINILIVDDEPKNLAVLEAVLDNPTYRLVRADSAEQALLALLVEEFALLILDIRMPGVTGFELAQLVKDRKKTAQLPIIFLTAYYNEDQHVLEGYGSGAIDYLHKPVNAKVLRAKVAVFAELHRKHREAESANRALLAEVNSRRRAEEQLRDLNNTLEHQVSERTEHIRVLMNEVNHRSKNILSLVMVIAQQTAATRPEDFLQRFAKRVQALATNHDLLVKNQWQCIEVSELIRAQLAPFEDILGKRISLDGSRLSVTAKAAQSIGIAMHELVTNAAKYGALSNQNGHIEIGWQVENSEANERSFMLSWTENGGPPVIAPAHRGFGMRVIKDMVEMGLDGHVLLDYASAGLIWRLDCPASRILEEASYT